MVTATAGMMLVIACYYYAQLANRPVQGFVVASVGYIVLWVPIFMVVYGVESGTVETPGFVNIIVIGTFFQFSCFAFAQAYFLWRPKTLYSVEESVFLSLSLSAKVLLHWVIFVAALSHSEITTSGRELVPTEDTTQDVLYVVLGSLSGGVVLSLIVTYPNWICWDRGETLYG